MNEAMGVGGCMRVHVSDATVPVAQRRLREEPPRRITVRRRRGSRTRPRTFSDITRDGLCCSLPKRTRRRGGSGGRGTRSLRQSVATGGGS